MAPMLASGKTCRYDESCAYKAELLQPDCERGQTHRFISARHQVQNCCIRRTAAGEHNSAQIIPVF